MLEKIKRFLREVKVEIKHVNWLTKKEMVKHTLIVIGLSLGVAIFLGFFDFVFNFILSRFVI